MLSVAEKDLDLLFDQLSDTFRSAVRSSLDRFASARPIGLVDTVFPLPISRAAADDYVRITNLWKHFHRNRPIVLDLPARDCPGCGSTRHRLRFISHDLYPFHICEECRSFFVPHRVEEDFIERFLSGMPEAREISDRMMEGRDRETLASDHERFDAYFTLAEGLAGGKAGGKYLDIGCGVGHSIDAAKDRGYDAVGLEISRTALATAHARGRRCFHPDEWDAEDGFQLVSLFETLEHVADPLAILKSANARLAPQGLLMVTVPNGASWEVSMLSERSAHVYGGFDGVGHVNLLTPQGLTSLFRRAGFEPLLFDGQFGNNPLFLLSGILDAAQPAFASTGDGTLAARLPEPVVRLLSNIGPILTSLDRALLRSPITIALACRSEDAGCFKSRVAAKEADRRARIFASAVPPPPVLIQHVMESSQLFDPETYEPISGLISKDISSAFRRSRINDQVRAGLCIRSHVPLKFDNILALGRGRLKPGRYELALAALPRSGSAAMGVLDEKKNAWVEMSNIDPKDYPARLPFTLDGTTRVGFFITANNTEPAEVDLELFDAGVARVR